MFKFSKTKDTKSDYDVIIIGGGPAGVGAGIYAKRSGVSTLVIDSKEIGGSIASTWIVDNYPGLPGISGAELARKYRDHLIRLGVDVKEFSPVERVSLDGEWKTIVASGREYRARSIVLAMGVKPRKLGVPGEDRYFGRGVSTCAICDGPFFKDRRVAVVGGGDTAVKEALYLSGIVRELYHIHRRDTFRAERANVDELMSRSNVKFVLDSVVEEIYGDEEVRGIKVKNLKTGAVDRIELDGVFVFIGHDPNTELVRDIVELRDGYIVTDMNYMTNIPGVYAAGDIRYGSFKQLVNSIAEGAVAGYNAAHYSQKFR
ncbi:MAG: thioredoxin-disulfide reductase [Candidatus Micrarchaeota archaeon]|nr:thioredoxin-disulfide reductase [Candidatus Micrarchaeota archaeon]